VIYSWLGLLTVFLMRIIFSALGEIINLSKMAGKLIGMTSLSYPLTYVQRRLNFKFKKF
jgi:hypothetical protein